MRKRDNYNPEAETLWQIATASPGVEQIALELPTDLRAAYIMEQIGIAAVSMDPDHELAHQGATWRTTPTFWQRLAAAKNIGRTLRYESITKRRPELSL